MGCAGGERGWVSPGVAAAVAAGGDGDARGLPWALGAVLWKRVPRCVRAGPYSSQAASSDP